MFDSHAGAGIRGAVVGSVAQFGIPGQVADLDDVGCDTTGAGNVGHRRCDGLVAGVGRERPIGVDFSGAHVALRPRS
jgi:hypothetical protein